MRSFQLQQTGKMRAKEKLTGKKIPFGIESPDRESNGEKKRENERRELVGKMAFNIRYFFFCVCVCVFAFYKIQTSMKNVNHKIMQQYFLSALRPMPPLFRRRLHCNLFREFVSWSFASEIWYTQQQQQQKREKKTSRKFNGALHLHWVRKLKLYGPNV